jgi:hypothetical protein
MTATPVDHGNPDDPAEILRVLPVPYHEQFLAEYADAVEGARRPEELRGLRDLLRLWRLRAIAYSDPGYDNRMASARRGHADDFTPAEQVIPGWRH